MLLDHSTVLVPQVVLPQGEHALHDTTGRNEGVVSDERLPHGLVREGVP